MTDARARAIFFSPSPLLRPCRFISLARTSSFFPAAQPPPPPPPTSGAAASLEMILYLISDSGWGEGKVDKAGEGRGAWARAERRAARRRQKQQQRQRQQAGKLASPRLQGLFPLGELFGNVLLLALVLGLLRGHLLQKRDAKKGAPRGDDRKEEAKGEGRKMPPLSTFSTPETSKTSRSPV